MTGRDEVVTRALLGLASFARHSHLLGHAANIYGVAEVSVFTSFLHLLLYLSHTNTHRFTWTDPKTHTDSLRRTQKYTPVHSDGPTNTHRVTSMAWLIL